MDPDCHAFRDTLKKLGFIDRQPWMANGDWEAFRDGPAWYFLQADDATAERLWELIKPKERDMSAHAAPDLLKVCQEIVRCSSIMPSGLVKNARAAIAKATP